MTTENLNNFSITDADMQTILDDLAVDMDQILAGLNPALKQVNEKSDIFCTVADVKEGRSITGFFFSIRQQEQKLLF